MKQTASKDWIIHILLGKRTPDITRELVLTVWRNEARTDCVIFLNEIHQ